MENKEKLLDAQKTREEKKETCKKAIQKKKKNVAQKKLVIGTCGIDKGKSQKGPHDKKQAILECIMVVGRLTKAIIGMNIDDRNYKKLGLEIPGKNYTDPPKNNLDQLGPKILRAHGSRNAKVDNKDDSFDF